MAVCFFRNYSHNTFFRQPRWCVGYGGLEEGSVIFKDSKNRKKN